MILSLCLNPCMDKSAFLPRFSPDAPNRLTVERVDLGGKGVNVARVVRELGGGGLLVSFDFRGAPVAAAMEREGVPCRTVCLDAELRVNLKIRERETGRTLEISEQGAPVRPEDADAVTGALLRESGPGCWVSLSGSMPPGMPVDTYARICALLKEKGCQVAADCDGEALRAVLEEKPALIKPNAQEFFALTGADPDDDGAALNACGALITRGVGMVCLSRGESGALLVTEKGAWRCPAADVKVRGVQGAGDSMLAALLLSLDQGAEPGEALRFATAAAGASVLRPGTLLCRAEEVRALLSSLPPPQRCS